MTSISKNFLLFTVVPGLIFFAETAFAEASSGAGANDSAQRSTSAQARDSNNAQPKDSTDAQPKVAPQGPALFKLIDTNKDGRISLAEYVAYGKAADSSTGSKKTSAGVDSEKNSSSASATSNASTKSDAAKAAHADKKPNAIPEPDSPGPSILPSVSTRADKFTAEVFDILDIDHDKFLTQKELDALIGAHQISQP